MFLFDRGGRARERLEHHFRRLSFSMIGLNTWSYVHKVLQLKNDLPCLKSRASI